MLNLNIRLGGDVYVGDDVRIVVKNIDPVNKTVELQFHAPKEIKILRGQLYRRKTSPISSEDKSESESNLS